MTLFDSSLKDVSQTQRQQLHISAVNMFCDCPQRFFFRYILAMKRPPNAFLLVGKSVDESVTKNLDKKIDTGELLPRADVVEIAAAHFEKEQQGEPIELDAEEKRAGKSLAVVLGDAKDKTTDLAGLHCDECAPLLKPHRTRRRFSIDLSKWLRERARALREEINRTGSRYAAKILDAQAASLNAAARNGMDFVGEQDVVERFTRSDGAERLVIRDTKTSGKSPTKSLLDGSDKPGIADDSEQLTAYAAASLVLDGALPDAMVLDYLVKTDAKTPTLKYVPSTTTRTLDDVNVFLNRIVAVVHAMHEGVFPPTNPTDWRCSEKWCGYWAACPYSKHPVSVKQ